VKADGGLVRHDGLFRGLALNSTQSVLSVALTTEDLAAETLHSSAAIA